MMFYLRMNDLLRLQELNFSPIDHHFASFVCRLAGQADWEVGLAAALVSHYRNLGHVCIDLSRLAGTPLPDDLTGGKEIYCPEQGLWLQALRKSGVVVEPGETGPLVLSPPKLYLQRYWDDECTVADYIRSRVGKTGGVQDLHLLRQGVRRLFPGEDGEGVDWQKIAAVAAATGLFSVITGGPGTGKTSTVAKILALLIEQGLAVGGRSLQIRLAAPTGKATSRIQESLRTARGRLDCSEEVLSALPEEASTLHRLLGGGRMSGVFRYGPGNPLAVDAVIVDEASMIDLPMMARLMRALSDDCRLILLGDREQLASVEPGAVLGEICQGRLESCSDEFIRRFQNISGDSFTPEHRAAGHGIYDSIIELKRNYRFSSQSGIYSASRAVSRGEAETLMSMVQERQFEDISWLDVSGVAGLERSLAPLVRKHFTSLSMASDPGKALDSLGRFGILCALRKGPFGSEQVNASVQKILAGDGVITHDQFYWGRPLMITRNHYESGLYNGDVGVILPGSDDGSLRFFAPGDGVILKRVLPQKLPENETCYAMTVHKSQGSEFDHVLLIIPDSMSPVLCRELMYTALTRARKTVQVWGSKDVLQQAVKTGAQRRSGLSEKLEQDEDPG
ncbi:exodeoxyribonuclease V subunit alpha [Thermodesulfobacteriota bacterium]